MLASPLLDSIAEAPINEDFLQKLYRLIENLPASISEASYYDRLAVFSGNPVDYDDPSLSADELWETSLNGLFVKTRIDSNSGASEVSCVNGRGFNFDVAPSLVGIWCLLIYKVGDVGDVGGSE